MEKRELILHCSDSKYIQHGVEAIKGWHTDPKEKGGRGWSDIGYHLVGEKYGTYKGVDYGGIKYGRPLHRNGAHTLGHNNDIGYCLCGLSADFQKEQLKDLEQWIMNNYPLISQIRQHSDYEPNKPFCAGLTPGYMKKLNGLLRND